MEFVQNKSQTIPSDVAELSEFTTKSLRQRAWGGVLDFFTTTTVIAESSGVEITQRHFSFKKLAFITCVFALAGLSLHLGGIGLAALISRSDVGAVMQGAAAQRHWLNFLNHHEGVFVGALAKNIAIQAAAMLSTFSGLCFISDKIKKSQEEASLSKDKLSEIQTEESFHKKLSYAAGALLLVVCLCATFHFWSGMMTTWASWQGAGGLVRGTRTLVQDLLNAGAIWGKTRLVPVIAVKAIGLTLGTTLASSWLWDDIFAGEKDVLNHELCCKKLYSLGVTTAFELEGKIKEKTDRLNSLWDKQASVVSGEQQAIIEQGAQQKAEILVLLEELRWLRFFQPLAQQIL